MISRVELTVGTPRFALIWLSWDMMHYFRHDTFGSTLLILDLSFHDLLLLKGKLSAMPPFLEFFLPSVLYLGVETHKPA